MTNWMTAAGIALIAGGIATLICFRSVLFGRSAGRAGPQASAGKPADIQPASRRSRAGRRRGRAPERVEDDHKPFLAEVDDIADERLLSGYGPEPMPGEDQPPSHGYEPSHYDDDDEPELYEPGYYEPISAAYEPEVGDYQPEPGELIGLELVPDLPPGPEKPDHDDESLHAGDRYGHRIAGWVRPEYRQVRAEPPAGEYWTPIPVDLEPDHEPSAKGYGWPSPVERLPAVPDYQPATGFDLLPVEPEPTEAVISLDQRRRRPQRSWTSRNEKRPVRRERREWRLENEALPTSHLFAASSDDPPPVMRRRPRPRPRPSVDPADRSTRVYVSRHAAEPPPR